MIKSKELTNPFSVFHNLMSSLIRLNITQDNVLLELFFVETYAKVSKRGFLMTPYDMNWYET